MGLFGPSVSLDEELERALIGDSRSDRKLVTKGQAGIHGALHPGEQVNAIAIDQYTGWPTLVVTDRRLLVMDRGGKSLQKSLDPAQIDQAAPSPSGGVQVMNDTGNIMIRLGNYASAQALVRAINDALLSGRPRTIPTLYPKFFLDLLAATGTPATPTNMANFVERVFVMIMNQANSYFDQLDDPRAQAEFGRTFADGGPAERILNSVDDMIDWLWRWSPVCHRSIERAIQKIHDMLLEPHSFLHTIDGEIAPWSEWAST